MPCFRYDIESARWVDAYLTDGLVGYWSGESVHVNDVTALDASDQENDGTCNGGVTTEADGRVGHAFDMDGTDDYITTTLSDFTGGITIAGWVYPRSYGTPDRKHTHLVRLNHMFCIIRSGSHEVWGRVQTDGSITDCYGGSVPLDAWTHMAVTWDGSTVAVHADGTQVASRSPSGSRTVQSGSFAIGTDGQTPDGGIDGRVDDVRIYTRALSERELQALYRQGVSV
jgi:hypothetical protein